MDADRQAIEAWIQKHNINEVECLVPDLTGNARGKFIAAAQFLLRPVSKLPESIMVQTVTGNYTEQHDEFVAPGDTDMLLRPDPTTLRHVPWAREPTAQIIHDCLTQDGDLHPLACRTILRRVPERYDLAGLTPVVAPEMEFYLVSRNLDSDQELQPPVGRSGRRESARLSYSIDAVFEFESFIDDMYDFADAQELSIDTLIHENGAAQMEVNFRHGNPLVLADQIFVFKRTVRETALRHNICATFMAKPMQEEPGSAMHIHQSVLDTGSGENLFRCDGANASTPLRHYIGGLQRFTPELISLYAPNVNSYRRLAPEIAAPINLRWGLDNRNVAFRIPRSDPDAARVENRFPGADANPYLAIAASLASGLLGMQLALEPTEPYAVSSHRDTVEVARTLEEGLRKLRDSDPIRELFGDLFLRAYAAVKQHEFEAFNRVISSWEREHLLLKV